MGSFDKMSVWPVGYFRAFSSWLLRNRKTVSARLATINAEIVRIGSIKVDYLPVETEEGTRRTEERTGISVTTGSSLQRLLQAYIARGGNPLDISPFMSPDCVEVLEKDADGEPTKTTERYPYGGVYAPVSANPNEPLQGGPNKETGYGPFPGGFIQSDSYFPARRGGRGQSPVADETVKMMHQIRGWANQDIADLQNLEWQIIKLCDLKEQLLQEQNDVLIQAFGGVLTGTGSLDDSRFDPTLQVQVLVNDIDRILYETSPEGTVIGYKANENVAFLQFTFADLPSENRDPLGC